MKKAYLIPNDHSESAMPENVTDRLNEIYSKDDEISQLPDEVAAMQRASVFQKSDNDLLG